MNIIVCVKRVPIVTDAELEINKEETGIESEDLEFDINEWDNYAVEEAVRIKEKHGGKVTVITLGDEDSEDILRTGLAMGADEAIRIDLEGFEGSDFYGVARGLFRAIKEIQFDLVLTGVQGSDHGWGQVGLCLAELLKVPFASLVVGVEIQGKKAICLRELESNTQERIELPLPALLCIQTGINNPRYVSITGIRGVRNIKIRETGADELGLASHEIGQEGSMIASRRFSIPRITGGAEILKGSLDEVCERAARLIRDKGGMI